MDGPEALGAFFRAVCAGPPPRLVPGWQLALKAATLLETAARFYLLVEGNRRTAWTLMVLQLWIDGYLGGAPTSVTGRQRATDARTREQQIICGVQGTQCLGVR